MYIRNFMAASSFGCSSLTKYLHVHVRHYMRFILYCLFDEITPILGGQLKSQMSGNCVNELMSPLLEKLCIQCHVCVIVDCK